MRGIAQLDPNEWLKLYPMYDNLTIEQVDDLLIAATDFLENTVCSVVQDVEKRKRLIYLVAAHLAYLFYQDKNGNGGAGGLVGRLSSATEGSVSVGSTMSNVPFSAEFFLQSPFGFAFWQRTLVYRMGLYTPRAHCRRY